MNQKRQHGAYRQGFKQDAVALVTEQGYSAVKVAVSCYIAESNSRTRTTALIILRGV